MPASPWRWSKDCSLYAFGLLRAMIVPSSRVVIGRKRCKSLAGWCLEPSVAQPAPELFAADPHGGVVGAAVHAAHFVAAGVTHDVAAQIAGDGAPLGDQAMAGAHHRDVLVRAVLGALPAADAVILDDDLQRALAMDGVHRTTGQAVGIHARPAGPGHQEVPEPWALAHEPGDPAVALGARHHAEVAPRAGVHVHHEELLAVVETVVEEAAEHLAAHGIEAAVVAETLSRHVHEHLQQRRER